MVMPQIIFLPLLLCTIYFVSNTELKKPRPQRKNLTIKIHPERCKSIKPIIRKVILGILAIIMKRAKLINIPKKGTKEGIFINFSINEVLNNKFYLIFFNVFIYFQ
jgi:hypothetical protein